jgi:hypothetical protein
LGIHSSEKIKRENERKRSVKRVIVGGGIRTEGTYLSIYPTRRNKKKKR